MLLTDYKSKSREFRILILCVLAVWGSARAGSFTDARDGQTYRTVVIGDQTWMAENLNYADSVTMTNLKGNSWCYGNSADSCTKYGRLYTWTGAMNIDSSYQSKSAGAVISSPWQGACPEGWHMPTNDEWTILETAVGGDSTAGILLKSRSGWSYNGNGMDTYGFSALPAGEHDENFGFIHAGDYAGFWSATEDAAYKAYERVLDYDLAHMGTDYGKIDAFSVRCLKDAD